MRSGALAKMPRLAASEDGAAAVEFAFVLPVFLLLIAGLFDGARLVNQAFEVHAAAYAGATYAQVHGWDPQGVAQAVASATPVGASATPAPSLIVGCVRGQTITPPGGDGNCPGSQPPGAFVSVSAQAPFTPLMPWPALTWPSTIAAQAFMRVQ